MILRCFGCNQLNENALSDNALSDQDGRAVARSHMTHGEPRCAGPVVGLSDRQGRTGAAMFEVVEAPVLVYAPGDTNPVRWNPNQPDPLG